MTQDEVDPLIKGDVTLSLLVHLREHSLPGGNSRLDRRVELFGGRDKARPPRQVGRVLDEAFKVLPFDPALGERKSVSVNAWKGDG